MPRLNVWLPDELAATLRDELPDVNVSKVLQESLRGLLKCKHDTVACAACNAEVDRAAIAGAAKKEFLAQVMWELEDLIGHGGTAEGAGRIVLSVAKAHQVEGYWHQPRPSKAQQRRNADRRWLAAQARRLEEAADQFPGMSR